jgi:hypothetical protein
MPDWMPSLWIICPVVAAVIAAGLLVWRAFATKPARVGQRIGLWLIAAFFTFYGPVSAADPAWPPYEWAAAQPTQGFQGSLARHDRHARLLNFKYRRQFIPVL